jgi:hypothetical protein
VYVPAVTAVFAKAIVPVVVIGPPVRPVPVATEVTVPDPPAVDAIVWLGHVPVIVTFEPATNEGVAVPVPPFATASVPESVIVPEVVIGPPEVVRPVVPPETATEVTVPEPPPVELMV